MIFISTENSARLQVKGIASGAAMFQYYVYLAIEDFWERNWNSVLDTIDDSLSIPVRYNPSYYKSIEKP
jgi:hypothetical protein